MVIVPTYDWQFFLGENLNKLVGIKSLHHLRFSHDHKGSVFTKLKSDSPEVEHKLLKHDWCPTSTELPEPILPSGLSLSRQWYLFNKIWDFCPQESQDTTCPKPGVPEPTATTSTSSGTSVQRQEQALSLVYRHQRDPDSVVFAESKGTIPARALRSSTIYRVCVCVYRFLSPLKRLAIKNG